jgi:hypothetical protein
MALLYVTGGVQCLVMNTGLQKAKQSSRPLLSTVHHNAFLHFMFVTNHDHLLASAFAHNHFGCDKGTNYESLT